MINLYDRELVQIGQVSYAISEKFSRRTWSSTDSLLALMDEIEKYATDAFYKIGFIVKVDPTPLIAGGTPSISIDKRVNEVEFDYDEKQWEVLKAKNWGQKVLNEDKNPTGETVTGE